ncbi:MAG: hypothetical protein HYY24_25715 [Verrucomicrobia bacterium]|nr:hypothetical protein [Verrucomicrobiota bacterium]
MSSSEKSLLTLTADFALNTGLAIFVLVGQPDSSESVGARAASPSASGAVPELRLELVADGRFRIISTMQVLRPDELPAVLAARTNPSPGVIAVAYPADFRAGQVHAALLDLQRVFPKSEVNQVIQPQTLQTSR